MIEYWFMLPVGIIIATIAMMSGIGGALLFSPFFILILKLDPITAIATGLAIEMFGFTSGVIGYLRKKLIDFTLIKKLIVFSIPATILGVIIGQYIPSTYLKIILVILLLFLAHEFILGKERKCGKVTTIDTTAKALVSSGGLLIGLISSGLGEINDYLFLKRMRLSTTKAAATSVFLVAMSAIVGVSSHAIFLINKGTINLMQVFAIIIFAVPGVIIGAQSGVYISQKINQRHMQYFLGGLFLFLGIIMIITMVQI